MKQAALGLVDADYFAMKNIWRNMVTKPSGTTLRRNIRNFNDMRRRPPPKKADSSSYGIIFPAAPKHWQQCRQ